MSNMAGSNCCPLKGLPRRPSPSSTCRGPSFRGIEVGPFVSAFRRIEADWWRHFVVWHVAYAPFGFDFLHVNFCLPSTSLLHQISVAFVNEIIKFCPSRGPGWLLDFDRVLKVIVNDDLLTGDLEVAQFHLDFDLNIFEFFSYFFTMRV